MYRLILFILLCISFTSSASHVAETDSRICAPFRGGVVDPAIVDSMLQAAQEGKLYRIRAKSSNVGFCVNSAIGRVEAEFKGIEGGFALRKEVWGDQSQMLVMVDANSLAMEDDFIKSMLMGENFLDTYTYSKILFVSTGLKWMDNRNAVLEGMLTMHGVTRKIRFEVKMNLESVKNSPDVADIVVIAKSFIDRTDFGMNRLKLFVDDKVELCMRIEAALFKK